MRNNIITGTLISSLIILILILVMWGDNYLVSKQSNKPAIPYVQKFRFGEQCPDRLRVEYVSSIRLPKSVICQKAVGE